MLPKFSLSLVLLVYTGRLIDTKSILLLRGISKSVRPRQTVPCPGARRRLIQGREKYLIIKFSQYFLKFWLIYLDTFYPQSRVEESGECKLSSKVFFDWKLKNLCPTSQAAEVEAVCAITSAECDLSCPRPRNNWGLRPAGGSNHPQPRPPSSKQVPRLLCTVLYCTVLCCTVTVICRWLPVLWSVMLVTSKSRLKLVNCKYFFNAMKWP